MKKITFLLCFLIASTGFSQVVLEDFEALPASGFEGFEGLGGANIVANPSVDANNPSATVGELIVVDAGQPWQGANLVMQTNYLDVTTPVTQTVDVDVYSLSAFNMLARLADAQSGATESAADVSHTGSGWETLTFTFNQALDATGVANGEYGIIAFFPNWNGAGWHDPEIERTVYIDNLTGFAGAAVVVPPADPEAAPLPTSPDGETYSIYNDTNGYTTFFPFAYDFGTLGGEPDLDPGAGTNLAYKFDFGFAGYGVGEGGPDDVTAYDFVSFDYWASDPTPGFRFVLISNDGAVVESSFEVGTDVALTKGAWTKVVIPMSFFTNLGFSDAHLFQWKADAFMGTSDPNSIVYIDNILLTVNDPSLSLNDFETAQFKVYPNPASEKWNVTSNSILNSVEVFDVLGKQVISLSPKTNDVVIDASNLNPGMYFAQINGANGSKTIKLIKD